MGVDLPTGGAPQETWSKILGIFVGDGVSRFPVLRRRLRLLIVLSRLSLCLSYLSPSLSPVTLVSLLISLPLCCLTLHPYLAPSPLFLSAASLSLYLPLLAYLSLPSLRHHLIFFPSSSLFIPTPHLP